MKFSELIKTIGLAPPPHAEDISLRYDPFPHQVSGFKSLMTWDRSGLYDDAGAGKTYPLQAFCTLYALLGNKIVVGMPPVLLDQFYDTYHEFFQGVENYLSIEIFRGTVPQRDKLIQRYDSNGWPDVLLMTYQMFCSFHRLKPRADKKVRRKDGTSYVKKGHAKDKHNKLLGYGYNILVLDESQAVKNISSDTTKVVRRFVDDGEAGLVLSTGSPLGNTPEDCYAPVKLITPDIYRDKKAFERQHIVRNIFSPFKEIIDFQNLDVLHRNVFRQARRVTKREVNKDMPEKILTRVPVKISAAHRKLYRELLTKRILEFDGQVLDATNNSKLRMTALQLISNPDRYVDTGSTVENEMDTALDTLIDMIDPGQHKIIVFSNFKATVARLFDRYRELNPVTINSETKNVNKSRLAFTEDAAVRMIVINYQSGGVGLNLQAASHSVFFEPTSVPSQFHQAMARTDRTGQHAETVNGYLLCPVQTWAEKQINNLLDKDEVANEVIKDPDKLLKELLG